MRFAPPKVGQVRLRAGRFCFGRAGRCSALTRRNAILLHGVVNCGPAKGYVWPVLAPAEGLVRAGTVLRGGAVLLQRFAFGSRRLCGSLEMSCVRFTPAVCRISAKQDGLRYLAFLFRAGRDRHSCVLAALFGYLPLWVHFGIVRLFVAISTGLPGTLGYGAGGAAFVRLCAAALVLLCFPPGVRWGYAPQTCAKEPLALWTLLI